MFQVIAGTEEDYIKNTPDIQWSYLSNTGWKPFPAAAILFDSTKADAGSKRSLVQSGIIEFALPKDATDQSTLIRPGFIWISAQAEESATTSVLALPKLLAIHAQAGRVMLSNTAVATSHFAAPLPAETITQMRQRQALVRKISQLYPGFAGRADEPDQDYYRRISERLRHRNRAITAWDYERLTLEAFPDVRAVKCLQHTNMDDTCANGHVTVVVLPWLLNPEYQHPLQPQPSASLLEGIKGFLRERANLFVAHVNPADPADEYLHVARPDYQEVAVAVSVKFHPGIADDETLMLRLDQDISAFIAPWAFDETIPPRFGTALYRSDLLIYLESLVYVDYIETLLIGMVNATIDFKETKAANIIQPQSASSILSSFQQGKEMKYPGLLPTGVQLDQEFNTFLESLGPTTSRNESTPHHFIHVIPA